jgi:non-heme Fe2+,alpha-ketoglutarate-dependent halogenase
MGNASERRGLEPDRVEQFRALGFVGSIDVLSDGEVAYYASRLQDLLARSRPDALLLHKPHLRFKWVSDLVHHPRVVDAVADILGADVLAWRSTFFVKAPGDPAHVPWHQDLASNPLRAEGYASAWIALTDSGPANGCMRVVPGSHHRGHLPHAIGSGSGRTLQLGQAITEPIQEEHAVEVALRAGQMSLHHGQLIHGSHGNSSPELRVGLAVRYVSPASAPSGRRESATLVRGDDRDHSFEHEPVPAHDDDPVALEWHARSIRRYLRDTLMGTLRRPNGRAIASILRVLARRENLRIATRILRPRSRG